MGKKAMVFLGLGILFIVYYFLCGQYGGFHLSFLFIWLAAGLVCLGFAFLEFRFGKIPIPLPLKRGSIAVGLILLALFVIAEGLVINRMKSQGEPELDYIIVLGAGVKGTRPTKALRHRIETAADYLQENPNTLVIASGGQGHGENISEAACIRAELVARGIAENRIFLEDQSQDTVENIVNSFQLITDREAKVGIVTNNFHVFRAVRIARKMEGRQIVGIAAPFHSVLLPHYMVREFFSLVLEGIKGKL